MKLRIYKHNDKHFSIEDAYWPSANLPNKIIFADVSLIERFDKAFDEYYFMMKLLEELYKNEG